MRSLAGRRRTALPTRPGVAISVDPSGIPIGGTVEPGPKVKGEVAPMPEACVTPGVVV